MSAVPPIASELAICRHVSNLAAAAREQIEPEPALAREAFEIAQWASQSAAAAAKAAIEAVKAKGHVRKAGGSRTLVGLKENQRINPMQSKFAPDRGCHTAG
jgi:hypothetical protein